MKIDPSHLAALAAIARHGSFDAATGVLLVTPSAVSQRIKAFEDRVGAALIERGTPCQATRTGRRLIKFAEDIGLLEAQLQSELGLGEARQSATQIRIAVNADSLATWFVDALALGPDWLFDLVIDDQDTSLDWLKRGEVSAAVTVSGVSATGCEAVDLGALRYRATASPAFMARWFADGVSAEAIAQAPCLTFNTKDALQRNWLARHFEETLSPPLHYVPSSQAFVDAAVAGLGWGMNPEVLTNTLIAQGRLVELIPDAPFDTHLCWQVSRVMKTALAPLTDAVLKAAQRDLRQL